MLFRSRTLTVTGVYTSDDDDDATLYAPLAVVQELSGHPGQVEEVEVKALTTPENDLSRKVSQNPAIVSSYEWETWYCTFATTSGMPDLDVVDAFRGVCSCSS